MSTVMWIPCGAAWPITFRMFSRQYASLSWMPSCVGLHEMLAYVRPFTWSIIRK